MGAASSKTVGLFGVRLKYSSNYAGEQLVTAANTDFYRHLRVAGLISYVLAFFYLCLFSVFVGMTASNAGYALDYLPIQLYVGKNRIVSDRWAAADWILPFLFGSQFLLRLYGGWKCRGGECCLPTDQTKGLPASTYTQRFTLDGIASDAWVEALVVQVLGMMLLLGAGGIVDVGAQVGLSLLYGLCIFVILLSCMWAAAVARSPGKLGGFKIHGYGGTMPFLVVHAILALLYAFLIWSFYHMPAQNMVIFAAILIYMLVDWLNYTVFATCFFLGRERGLLAPVSKMFNIVLNVPASTVTETENAKLSKRGAAASDNASPKTAIAAPIVGQRGAVFYSWSLIFQFCKYTAFASLLYLGGGLYRAVDALAVTQ